MKIIRLDSQTMKFGEDAYRCFQAVEKLGLARFRGRRAIVGAIRACIKNGVIGHNDIAYTVRRITGCTHTTISTIMREFTGRDHEMHFWAVDKNKKYSLIEENGHRTATICSVWITN